MSHEAKDGRGGRRGRPDGPRRGLAVETLERRQLLAGGAIGGFVFHDADGNGKFDPGETPIAGSALQLVNSSGVVVATATTDASGAYKFTSDRTAQASPATIAQKVSFPEAPTNFTSSLSASQFDPALGTLVAVDLAHSGTMTSQIQVESRDSAPSTIVANVDGTMTTTGPGMGGLALHPVSSRSFDASAFDGTLDFAGSSGKDLGAVPASDTRTVTLTSPADLAPFVGTGSVTFTEAAVSNSSATGAGNLVSMVTTAASASIDVVYHYVPPAGLKPGQYTVVQTAQPPGYSDGIDSKGGVPLPSSAGTDSIPVTLAGSDLAAINFGEWLPNSLSGYVYLDSNNDGQRTAGEFGIATVDVTLRGYTEAGEAVKLTATTDANGFYRFAGLFPGQYSLSEAQPPIFASGRVTPGTQGGTAGANRISRIDLRAGVQGTGNNFAERATADCKLNVLMKRVSRGEPIPTSLGRAVERYLPGLVSYAQQHPLGPSARSGR